MGLGSACHHGHHSAASTGCNHPVTCNNRVLGRRQCRLPTSNYLASWASCSAENQMLGFLKFLGDGSRGIPCNEVAWGMQAACWGSGTLECPGPSCRYQQAQALVSWYGRACGWC